VISRLVGTHVQRLATIARGDSVCTTNIPSAAISEAHHRTSAQHRTSDHRTADHRIPVPHISNGRTPA
jgi:hypothetical protein